MTAVEPNVHFREHDIEFLQKRTKLWLETVLEENLGDRTLANLISDGNLLYRVSKYITREMTGMSPGPQEISPKTFSEAAIYSKHSGKYLPYANVDTFLKICRKLGLTDVELFTPPDAVEGKDIRRVCTSIRSLARKARAQHIRVPDFEDVNRPLPMPKEKVGEIREYLQHPNSNPVTPTAAMPAADVQKSERVQIISNFLSATSSSPEDLSEEEIPVPSTPPLNSSLPASVKSLSSDSLSCNSTSWSSPSTPTATVGGLNTPKFTKSLSALPFQESGPTPRIISTDEPTLDETPTTPMLLPARPADQPYGSSISFSQRRLGPFRHAQPHFIKRNPRQGNLVNSIDGVSGEDVGPGLELVEEPPTTAVSSAKEVKRTKDSAPFSQLGLGSFRHAQPHFIKKSSSQGNLIESYNDLSDEAQLSRTKPERIPSTEASDHSARLGEDLSSHPQLDMGSHRHAQPQVALQGSARSTSSGSSHSDDIQSRCLESLPESDPTTLSTLKLKPPSSNKIVEREPRSLKMPVIATPKCAKVNQSAEVPVKDQLSKPQAKAPGTQLNARFWMPLVAGALAFLGTLLVVRTRDPVVYEVKQGDTLSKISKQVGRNSWDELVKLNPSISNPNLIYPSERLRLPV